MNKITEFGTLLGISPCSVILHCDDIYNIAYILSRLTRVGFSKRDFDLECDYYRNNPLSGIIFDYDTPELRRLDSRLRRGIQLSDEEQAKLTASEKKFTGTVDWSSGDLYHYSHTVKNEAAKSMIFKLWQNRNLLTEFKNSQFLGEVSGETIEKALVNKLMRCSDAQIPYLLSQSVSEIIFDYDTLYEIRRFSESVQKEIIKSGEKKVEAEPQTDWSVIPNISLEDTELKAWKSVREIITVNGWDRLDGGMVATSLSHLFRCAVLSDRSYNAEVAMELEKCGFYFLFNNSVQRFIEKLKLVVFAANESLVDLNSESYQTLVSCWLNVVKLLEERYIEVGEAL